MSAYSSIIMSPIILLSTYLFTLTLYGVYYEKLEINIIKKIGYLTIYALLIIAIILNTQYQYLETTYIMNDVLQINNIILTCEIVIILITIPLIYYSLGFNKENKYISYEFYVYILFILIGLILLIMSNDVLLIYLSLELQSFTLYLLATYNRHNILSTEAGLKYFLLGAVSSGFLLLGIAILYGITGTTNVLDIGTIILLESEPLIQIGLIFFAAGFLFKVTAAPFHVWVPDVYEGAPTIVTTIFATLPKLPLLGIFYLSYGNYYPKDLILMSIIMSLIIGSLGAINQSKFKRMFAYSTIGHTGLMLLAFVGNYTLGLKSLFHYVLIYIIMTLNNFGIILSFYKPSTKQTNEFIAEIYGLSRSNLILAITLTIMLFSLAGIPPLAGFYIKMDILTNAISANNYLIAILGILSSVIAAIYSIKIIHYLFFKVNREFIYKTIIDIINPYKTMNVQQAMIISVIVYIIIALYWHPLPLYLFINNIF